MNAAPETDAPKPRRGFLRRWLADRSGVVAIFAVIMMPVIVGIGGLAVDVGTWYVATESTQGVADAASFAGALTYEAGDTALADISNQALAVVALNGFINSGNASTTTSGNTTTTVSGNTTVTVSTPPTSGTYKGSSGVVQVNLQVNQPQLLSGMLGNFNITTNTAAWSGANSVYCILALGQQSANPGVSIPSFIALINLMNSNKTTGCSIGDNATGAKAMSTNLIVLLSAYTAVIGGSLNGCILCTWIQTPTQNTSTTTAYPIPDPYSDRTQPTATAATALTAVTVSAEPATVAATAAPAIPAVKAGSCAYTVTITSATPMPLAAGCYLSVTVTGTMSLSTAGTVTICGVTIPAGDTLKLTTGTFQFFPPSPKSGSACAAAGTAMTVDGTLTVSSPAVATFSGTTGLNVAGGSATLASGSSIYSGSISSGTLSASSDNLDVLTISGGTVNLSASNAWTTSISAGSLAVTGASNLYSVAGGNGLTVSGTGVVTIAAGGNAWTTSVGGSSSAGSYALTLANGASTLYGLTANCASNTVDCVSLGAGNTVWQANVSSGIVTFNNTGGTTCKVGNSATLYTGCFYGLTVSGGLPTLSAGNYGILGPTGQAGVTISSGTLTMNSNSTTTATNVIQGAASYPAINMSGGTFTMTSTTAAPINNNILAGSSEPAINMTAGTFTMGTGTNNIQGASNTPSIELLTGSPTFITSDGSTDNIGNQPPSAGVPAILIETADTSLCNLLVGGTRCDRDLELGSGTYTIWEGLTDSGGNVTLNYNATSIGTYIFAGGEYCMGGSACPSGANGFTVGDLNANDATIELVEDTTNTSYATFTSVGADGVNIVAPTTGNTAGLGIMQNNKAPTTGSNTFEGVSFLSATGALYFPDQPLTFNGLSVISGGGTSGSSCLQLIGYTVTVEGLAFMQDQCSGVGVNLATGFVTNALATLLE